MEQQAIIDELKRTIRMEAESVHSLLESVDMEKVAEVDFFHFSSALRN